MTVPTATLYTGSKIPVFGLGTWLANPGEVRTAVRVALESGYTHIDAAHTYGNEFEVGQGIKDWGGDRTKIWITSKLWNYHHRSEDVAKGLEISLNDLGVEYLDLYLIHWPISFKPGGPMVPRDENGVVQLIDVPLTETWRAMEKLVESGKVRNIGFSNFNYEQIESILKIAKIKPAVHQFETHPYLPLTDFIEYHKKHGIHVTAYSPFGNQNPTFEFDKRIPRLIEHSVITKIAEKHGVNGAQIVLAWGIQRGTSVVPKSITSTRVKSNFEALKVQLDKDDIEKIRNIGIQKRFNNPSEGWGYKSSLAFHGLDN